MKTVLKAREEALTRGMEGGPPGVGPTGEPPGIGRRPAWENSKGVSSREKVGRRKEGGCGW